MTDAALVLLAGFVVTIGCTWYARRRTLALHRSCACTETPLLFDEEVSYTTHAIVYEDLHLALLQALEALATPYARVFPRVPVSSFIFPHHPADRGRALRAFDGLNTLHVDALVCDTNTYQPLFAVLLLPEAPEDSQRELHERTACLEAIFRAAALPLVTLPRSPQTCCEDALRPHVTRFLPETPSPRPASPPMPRLPLCPICRAPMVLWSAPDTDPVVTMWRCSHYPLCDGHAPVEESSIAVVLTPSHTSTSVH